MGLFTALNNNARDYYHNMIAQKLAMASLLSLVLSISISILLFTHLYFVYTSSSSIESGGLITLNPFFESNDTDMTLEEFLNRSTWQKFWCFSKLNFQQHFGTSKLHWFLPLKVPFEQQTCDGIHWKLRKFAQH